MKEQDNRYSREEMKEQAGLKLIRALTATHLSLESKQKELVYSKIRKKAKISDQSRVGFISIFARYAAVLLIGAVVYHLLFLNSNESTHSSAEFAEVIVPVGQMAELILPDSTHVVLNSNSSLKYRTSFNKKKRGVELVGEGYFTVAKNTEIPFIVSTNIYDIKVTGTQFNVEAYADESITTTLVEGEVVVEWEDAGQSLVMKPGESVEWSLENNKLKKYSSETFNLLSWQKGLIQFRSAPMQQVATYIERWYNVDVKFENKNSQTVLVNGTMLKDKPVLEVLNLLEMTGQVDYEIIEKGHDRPIVIIK
ncbi:MAG: FecR family protein [Marinilabiliaceae bacterium]|nr:FecR family protein [Marinilabiliaceae bacterium]